VSGTHKSMSTLVLVFGFAGTDNAYLQSLIVDFPLQYHIACIDVYSILELTSYTASK